MNSITLKTPHGEYTSSVAEEDGLTATEVLVLLVAPVMRAEGYSPETITRGLTEALEKLNV